MKNKQSRRIIGTFAEISNLIRSFPQFAFDSILDTSDEYWRWLLKVYNVKENVDDTLVVF